MGPRHRHTHCVRAARTRGGYRCWTGARCGNRCSATSETALTPPMDRDPSEERRPGCAAVSSRRALRGGRRRHRPRAAPAGPPPLPQPAKTPATSRLHASAAERPARPAAARPKAPAAVDRSTLGAPAREQARKRPREPLRRCPRAQRQPGFPLAVRAAAQPALMVSWVESPVPARSGTWP